MKPTRTLPTNAVDVPKSSWRLRDETTGKEFLLEVHLDWQGILHLLATRALKNKSRRANLYRGMIRSEIKPLQTIVDLALNSLDQLSKKEIR